MRTFYIPEIGDEIVLDQDWTFNLYPEQRNEALGAAFGFYLGYGEKKTTPTPLVRDIRRGWISETVLLPKCMDINFKVEYPDRELFFKRDFLGNRTYDCNANNIANRKAEDECMERQLYYKESAEHSSKAYDIISPDQNAPVIVIIPKGTLLKIDRIYIRKGASDYSSITFYAKGFSAVDMIKWDYRNSKQKTIKHKALRFWAKLSDCNEIVFK